MSKHKKKVVWYGPEVVQGVQTEASKHGIRLRVRPISLRKHPNATKWTFEFGGRLVLDYHPHKGGGFDHLGRMKVRCDNPHSALLYAVQAVKRGRRVIATPTPGREKLLMKQGCLDAQLVEEEIRRAATQAGLKFRVNVIQTSGRPTLHWMFDWCDKRILNYWPGNGSMRSPLFTEVRKVSSPQEALDSAIQLIGVRVDDDEGW
jgi:hypothetical protein